MSNSENLSFLEQLKQPGPQPKAALKGILAITAALAAVVLPLVYGCEESGNPNGKSTPHASAPEDLPKN
jgi:hypothetical protein